MSNKDKRMFFARNEDGVFFQLKPISTAQVGEDGVDPILMTFFSTEIVDSEFTKTLSTVYNDYIVLSFERSTRMRRLENLSWAEASEYVKKGFAIQRAGWNALNQFVGYTPSREVDGKELWGEANRERFRYGTGIVKIEGYYTLKTVRETINVGWRPVISDLETKDWQVVDPITYEVLGEVGIQTEKKEGDAV